MENEAIRMQIIHSVGGEELRAYQVEPELPFIHKADPFFIKEALGLDSVFECVFLNGPYEAHKAVYVIEHKPDAVYVNRRNLDPQGVVSREMSFIAPLVDELPIMGVYQRPQEVEIMTLVGDAMDDQGFNELWYSPTKGYMLVSRIRPYNTPPAAGSAN